MSTVGGTFSVIGELRSGADITIAGRIEGHVLCEPVAVVLAPSAHIVGDVVARDITVFGVASGKLIATDVVDIRPGAIVTGQIIAPRFVLTDGAYFSGRVEPQHLEAALRISRFEQDKRDAASLSHGESGGASPSAPGPRR